jgi:hypothetical protein
VLFLSCIWTPFPHVAEINFLESLQGGGLIYYSTLLVEFVAIMSINSAVLLLLKHLVSCSLSDSINIDASGSICFAFPLRPVQRCLKDRWFCPGAPDSFPGTLLSFNITTSTEAGLSLLDLIIKAGPPSFALVLVDRRKKQGFVAFCHLAL